MNEHSFSDLPEWDDPRFNFTDEERNREEWKHNPTREACKGLYQKWQEVVFLLNGVIKPYLEDESGNRVDPDATEDGNVAIAQMAASDMISEAYEVASKIVSSEATALYVCRMENAAIIRKLAQSIASTLLILLEDDAADEGHIVIVREEIDVFRKLFIKWVGTFEKDEFRDEWGLFV